MIYQLNVLKNRQLTQFDRAFSDSHSLDALGCDLGDEAGKSTEDTFIQDVRQIFFSFLKPILEQAEKLIDTERDANDKSTVFGKYFNQADFVDLFEGSTQEDFVKRLVYGSSFQHFCDDYFSEEITNYQMF